MAAYRIHVTLHDSLDYEMKNGAAGSVTAGSATRAIKSVAAGKRVNSLHRTLCYNKKSYLFSGSCPCVCSDNSC